MSQMNFERTLDVHSTPDVLVVGAGCAGTIAAISAARKGASVVLVERFGFAGGYITGVIGASLDGFVDLRSGLPVVGGVVREFAENAIGATKDLYTNSFSPSGELREMKENPTRRTIRFDIEGFKLQADRLFKQAGVKVLYYTSVVDVIERDGHVEGVVIGNKAGLSVIKPKTIVDASGDADVAAWAGADFDFSEHNQPMSLHFRVGGVHIDAKTRDQCSAVLVEAHNRGDLGLYGGPWIGRISDTEVYFNACRAPGRGTVPDDLTHAEVQGREDAHLMFDLFKAHVSGFENSFLSSSGPFVGVRESRRITGDSQLTGENVRKEVGCDDVIALGAWWMDQHPVDKAGYHMHELVRPYDIGYGTLLPRKLDNVWVAGRCHSADSLALASSRVTVTAMGMGEAAGTAAAMACARNTDSRGFPVRDLQSELLAGGAIICEEADRIRAIGDAVVDKPASMVR
jgi:hypothetical protein